MGDQIRLLDCTLRDGGHLNEGRFGEEVITNTIKKLSEARIDIIEVGFLWNKQYGKDTSRYYSMNDVKRILPEDTGTSKISVMSDFNDLKHLEPYDGSIEYIRVIFKRHLVDWAIDTVRMLKDKGYKCFMNPVNCNVYTDSEYLELIEKINPVSPYAFSIVDTFGVFRMGDMIHRYLLVEENLDKKIVIGLHLHENLGLAYGMAQRFTEIVNPVRKVVIDGSLLGMGRDPGNLRMEQIAEYMNTRFGKDYDLEPVYDAIDEYIAPIKEKIPWGYSLPYALSARYKLHRTYAEYLMGKKDLRTKDIDRIMSGFDMSESELFNEKYIESLYMDYLSKKDSGEKEHK